MAIDLAKKRMRGLRAALRKAWMWYGQNRRDAADGARVNAHEWRCAACQKTFKRGDIEIDHPEPAGSLQTWDDLLPFVKRLFLQKCVALCEGCHQKKTNAENDERRARRGKK